MRTTIPVLLLLGACSGVIGDLEENDRPEPPPPSEAEPPPSSEVSCATPEMFESRMRRLTRTEYGYAVQDLLGADPDLTDSLAPDEWSDNQRDGLTNGFLVGSYVPPLLAEQYLEMGHTIAATRVDHVMATCDGLAGEPCALELLSTVGTRAFRRPISAERRETLMALYRLGAETSPRSGMLLLLEGLLIAPEFIYRLEAMDHSNGDVVALDGWEIAARMASALWRSVPDEELIAAAAGGALDTVEGRTAQANRMLDHPRADRAFEDFFGQWAGLRHLDHASRDPELYPVFDDRMRDALKESFRRFAIDIARTGSLRDLFLADTLWVGPGLESPAAGAPSDAWEKRTLAGTGEGAERRGILGHPAFLAAHAHSDQTDPIRRGLYVRQRVLCQPLRPPAGLELPPPPERAEGLTTRERFAQHREDPACAGCHSRMDPIGFGFEHFDAVGAYRELEDGLPIDDSGAVTGADLEVETFQGVAELAHALAGSDQVRACVARQWLHFATAAPGSEQESCSVARGYEALEGGDLRDLFLASIETPGFLQRRVPQTTADEEGASR